MLRVQPAIFCRAQDGWPALKRLIEEVERDEAEARDQAELTAASARVAALQNPFVVMAPVTAWLEHFTEDAMRFPILILLARSRCGKTEYAKRLFKKPLELKIGMREDFPAGMKEFDRSLHAA